MEQETLEFFEKNLKKWRCPRCISCSKCDEYIYEPENLQCLKCGRVFCRKCRPKNGSVPIFPYNNWCCNLCFGKYTLSSLKIIKSPIKKEVFKKSGKYCTFYVISIIKFYFRITKLFLDLVTKYNRLQIVNDKNNTLELSLEEKNKLENLHDWSSNQQKSEKNIQLISSALNLTNNEIVLLKDFLKNSNGLKIKNLKNSIKPKIMQKKYKL